LPRGAGGQAWRLRLAGATVAKAQRLLEWHTKTAATHGRSCFLGENLPSYFPLLDRVPELVVRNRVALARVRVVPAILPRAAVVARMPLAREVRLAPFRE